MLTGVLRQARRRAAVNAYLEAGWPIAPGAWWDPRAEQYRCRRIGCLTTGTIHAADGMTPRRDPSSWSHDPATILLVTGHGIDVVELPLGSTPPEAIFSRTLIPGPVALWTSVRPRLLVVASTTAGGVLDKLPDGLPEGALLHSSGSYVPLPPSRVRTGDVVWMRPPHALGWHLPDLAEVLDLLGRRVSPPLVLSTGELQLQRDVSRAPAADVPLGIRTPLRAVSTTSLRSSSPRKA
jgi:hypothetical protein